MTLDDFLRLLETADNSITAESARLLVGATEDLRAYAQRIAHRQTGHMADTMHHLGPFPTGQGGLETQIESGAFYAEDEVSRGGTHDWAGRTLEERADRIAQLSDELAREVALILTGDR